MILKCPKCNKTEFIKKNEHTGELDCQNCNYSATEDFFNVRTQNFEQVLQIVYELVENDLRIGQIFKIVEMSLKGKGKDMFYVENDVLFQCLNDIKEKLHKK